MPMLMSTGKCPSPSGRKTSALSLAPSRIGMSTSFSTLSRYCGSDCLLGLWTCSCTVFPNARYFSTARRQSMIMLRQAPCHQVLLRHDGFVVDRSSPLRLLSRGRCCIFRTGSKPGTDSQLLFVTGVCVLSDFKPVRVCE